MMGCMLQLPGMILFPIDAYWAMDLLWSTSSSERIASTNQVLKVPSIEAGHGGTKELGRLKQENYHSFKVRLSYRKKKKRERRTWKAGLEMAQQLGALDALSEDLGSMPSIHMVTHCYCL